MRRLLAALMTVFALAGGAASSGGSIFACLLMSPSCCEGEPSDSATLHPPPCACCERPEIFEAPVAPFARGDAPPLHRPIIVSERFAADFAPILLGEIRPDVRMPLPIVPRDMRVVLLI